MGLSLAKASSFWHFAIWTSAKCQSEGDDGDDDDEDHLCQILVQMRPLKLEAELGGSNTYSNETFVS